MITYHKTMIPAVNGTANAEVAVRGTGMMDHFIVSTNYHPNETPAQVAMVDTQET